MHELRIPTTPLHDVPAWAVLERRLFDATEEAWRLFSDRYTGPDGRILHAGGFEHRDGVDDLYEPFFNWPAFYALGGNDDVLVAAKHHFEGVTAQLTEAGMLSGEYENGYDWFHQGESLLFFYNLCAADPGDERFAARARRFAELYTDPAHGNYDPARNIVTAPHNGARGPLEGLGTEWLTYPASQDYMRAYGLPLHGLPGITRWDDLADPARAQLMGAEMQRRAAGDTAVNLAATSLVTNRWLYDGDAASAAWVARYVDGWRERAAAGPGGLMPDNVAPDGAVGGLHDGAWYGGHYGWTWPHGLHSVGMSTLIGAINASFVSGSLPGMGGARDDGPLELVRTMLDTVLDHAITAPVTQTPFSLRGGWLERLGPHAAEPALLVPYRHGADGWFDFGPLQLDLPTWLWWWTRDDADRKRLDRVLEGMPGSAEVRPFRDKVEAGHEGPWLAFLDGRLPDYPERALSMALGQLARRVAVMDAEPVDPATVHLHFWQRANPVVTEVLGQLVTGTPQTLYNGGLPFAAVAYTDADRGRPGLPPDVAALVTSLDARSTYPSRDRGTGGRSGDGYLDLGEAGSVELALVNLSTTATRRVRVRPSRFGEQRLVGVVVRGETGGAYPRAVDGVGRDTGGGDVRVPPPRRRRRARGAAAVAPCGPRAAHLPRRGRAAPSAPARRRSPTMTDSLTMPGTGTTALALPVRGGPFERADAAAVARLGQVSAATACAKLHGLGVTRTFVEGPRPLKPGYRVVGSALTLQFMPQREDLAAGDEQEYVERHTALWHVLETVQPGDVLVIQAFGSRFSGCVGDILARYFQRKGGAGIVVDGRIRDSGRIADLGLPVWSTGVTPHYASQSELFPWAYDVPVAVGGVLCLPGDLVVADDDGPVIVPRAMADEVVASARDHEEWEGFSRERLDEGARLSDYYPLTPDTRGEFEAWRSARSSVR